MTKSFDFTTILEAFQQSLLADDVSRNTVCAYLSDLRHFLSWSVQTTGTSDIDDITPTDIREYRELLQEQVPPAAPATINRRLAALRRFFAWAKEQQLTEYHPAERIRNVESVECGPQSLDRKQWHRLQRCVEQARGAQGIRDRCIIVMLYHTGLRAGELATLRLADVVLGERSGHVVVQRGKGNKARRVPLNSEARDAIRQYLLIRPASDIYQLFVGQRGEPLSAHAIYDVVVKCARQRVSMKYRLIRSVIRLRVRCWQRERRSRMLPTCSGIAAWKRRASTRKRASPTLPRRWRGWRVPDRRENLLLVRPGQVYFRVAMRNRFVMLYSDWRAAKDYGAWTNTWKV
jgi:site-specific recombinase XerD